MCEGNTALISSAVLCEGMDLWQRDTKYINSTRLLGFTDI